LCLIRILPSFVYSFACCLVTFLRDKFHFITFVPWSKHSKFLFFFASKLSSHFILWKHIWNLIFAQKYYFSLFSSSLIHSFHWIFARIVIFLFHFLIVFLHKKELLLYSSNFFSMFSSSSLFSFFFLKMQIIFFLAQRRVSIQTFKASKKAKWVEKERRKEHKNMTNDSHSFSAFVEKWDHEMRNKKRQWKDEKIYEVFAWSTADVCRLNRT
jgi:hypothetical protein